MEKNLCSENGTLPMTQDDWENIQWARVGLLGRVMAEVIKRLPEQDKKEILALIDGHTKAADQLNTGLVKPEAKLEYAVEEILHAEAQAAEELANMIRTPHDHLMTPKASRK